MITIICFNLLYFVHISYLHLPAGGSTLDAMSNAVENSCLVLIFFSEAYYKSRNCRAGKFTWLSQFFLD